MSLASNFGTEEDLHRKFFQKLAPEATDVGFTLFDDDTQQSCVFSLVHEQHVVVGPGYEHNVDKDRVAYWHFRPTNSELASSGIGVIIYNE